MSTHSDHSNNPQYDDVCVICLTSREMHGDKHHEFSLTGQLIPVRPGEPSRKAPPKERVAPQPLRDNVLAEHVLSNTLLRLLDTLTEKGLLSASDLLYILGGDYGPNRKAEKSA